MAKRAKQTIGEKVYASAYAKYLRAFRKDSEACPSCYRFIVEGIDAEIEKRAARRKKGKVKK